MLERIVPPGKAHLVLRLAAIALLVAFLVHRIAQYESYFFKPLWVVETLIYVVFICSYAARSNPVARSRGARDILVPLVGAVLPFALLVTPPLPAITRRPECLCAVFSSMTVSTAFTLWALWTLRRSFSVTVEARSPVSAGPYRLIRHPVYLGEMITAAVVMVWRLSMPNVVLWVLFCAIQLLRARWEEAKLKEAFPHYGQYLRRTWWFGGRGR